MDPSYVYCAVSFYTGAVISYFIGSSWGLGTLAVQLHTSLLLAIGAVFVSGTLDLLLPQ